MKYSPGKMGISEGIALSFAMTFPTIFLVTPAVGVETMGSIAWIMPLGTGILIILMLYLFTFVLERMPGDLFTISETLFGSKITKLLGGYYILLFLAITSGWIREFTENTLLTALPIIDFDIVVVWYGAVAAMLVYVGIENICRAIWLTIPVVILSLIAVMVGLLPKCQFFYLLPWQGNGLDTTIIPILRLTGENAVTILLIMLAASFQNVATIRTSIIYGVGLSCLLRSLTITVFVMSFGQVAIEKSLPFYEMARLVYVNRYIQRLEAIFIIIWVIAGIFAISLFLFGTAYILQRTFKLPTMRPLIPLITIIAIYISMLPSSLSVTVKFLFETYLWFNTFGIFIVPILFFLAALVKRRKKLCLQD